MLFGESPVGMDDSPGVRKHDLRARSIFMHRRSRAETVRAQDAAAPRTDQCTSRASHGRSWIVRPRTDFVAFPAALDWPRRTGVNANFPASSKRRAPSEGASRLSLGYVRPARCGRCGRPVRHGRRRPPRYRRAAGPRRHWAGAGFQRSTVDGALPRTVP